MITYFGKNLRAYKKNIIIKAKLIFMLTMFREYFKTHVRNSIWSTGCGGNECVLEHAVTTPVNETRISWRFC